MLDLGVCDKISVGRGDRKGRFGAGMRESCRWCSVTVLGTRLREQREEMSGGCLAGFLVGMTYSLAGDVCWSCGLGAHNE